MQGTHLGAVARAPRSGSQVPRPAPLTTLGTPLPRGPRAALRRHHGSELGLDRNRFLFKVLSVEGPVSSAEPTFDGPVDADICIDGHDDCRPGSDISVVPVKVSDAALSDF